MEVSSGKNCLSNSGRLSTVDSKMVMLFCERAKIQFQVFWKSLSYTMTVLSLPWFLSFFPQKASSKILVVLRFRIGVKDVTAHIFRISIFPYIYIYIIYNSLVSYICIFFSTTRDSVERGKSGHLWLRDTACPQRSLCDTSITQYRILPKKRSKRDLDLRQTKWRLL